MLRAKASSEKESIFYHSPIPGDERCFKAEIRYTCLYGQNAYFVCVTDITEQKSADEALRVSQDKFQLIAETTLDTIWVYNLPNRRFVFISPSIEKLLGYPLDEAMEMTLEQFLTTEASLEAHQTIAPAIKQFLKHPEESTCYTRDLLHKRKDGRSVWIEQTTQYRFNAQQEIEIIGVSHNIDERKKREEEVQFLYHHDQLTGLMNRNALSLKDSTDERNLERKASRSVIFMNLDDFSLVNDSGGYEHGDRMLKAVAEKLKVRVGRVGTIYRYGGDEFVVVIESGDLDYVMGIAKELMNSTSSQITIDQRKVFITTSIGICIQGQDGTLEQSVKNANTALYIAKRQKNRIVVYTPEMDKTRTREAILEVDMQDALEKGEFELHYQPIFDVNKGTINQVEALLRWNHPEFNRISPLDFIPIAERTKLIIPITDWIIKQACARIADWERIGIRNFTISINLSPLSFENRGQELMDFITRSITEAGIQPSSLKLEITESILMNDVDEVVKVFHALKTFGVKLALDDFGTGYSSFGYMKDLPLDILKLDRSLIDDIVSDVKEQKITESMITIIHGLGLEVVAEGVETREQLDYLLKYDCDYIQGYLFSRPLPRAEFEAYYFLMLEQRNELFTKHEKRKATKAHFELRPEWLSGHTEIDKQHESIMQIANGLINFALEARSKADMLVQVDYLLEHVAEHFKYEESVMAEIGYAGYDEHKNQHKKLLAKAHNLKEAYNNAEIESSAFFAFVMDDFTLGHLIQEDTKFFLY